MGKGVVIFPSSSYQNCMGPLTYPRRALCSLWPYHSEGTVYRMGSELDSMLVMPALVMDPAISLLCNPGLSPTSLSLKTHCRHDPLSWPLCA